MEISFQTYPSQEDDNSWAMSSHSSRQQYTLCIIWHKVECHRPSILLQWRSIWELTHIHPSIIHDHRTIPRWARPWRHDHEHVITRFHDQMQHDEPTTIHSEGYLLHTRYTTHDDMDHVTHHNTSCIMHRRTTNHTMINYDHDHRPWSDVLTPR